MDWILALLAVFVFVGGHDRIAFWIMTTAVVVSLGTIAWRLHAGRADVGPWLLPKLVILVVLSIAALWLDARAAIF